MSGRQRNQNIGGVLLLDQALNWAVEFVETVETISSSLTVVANDRLRYV